MICASFRNHIARLGILSALLSGAAIAETPPSPTHAWFRTTPLQSSYQLLVEGHPTQAWHELIHTLSTTPVAEPFGNQLKRPSSVKPNVDKHCQVHRLTILRLR